MPAMKDREEILKIHARNKPLSDDVSLSDIAGGTPGFSGADLENLLNEGALIAARRDKDKIEQDDINTARDKIILGLQRKNLMLSDKEKETVACHEAGHAIVAELLPAVEPVHKVSIIPREFSMGATQQLQVGDKYIFDKEYIENRVSVLLGGRAAEQIKLNTMTNGAENDLKEAQKIVRKMVLDWGMGDRFKNIAFGSQRQQVFLGEEIAHRQDFSEETNREIDEEIVKILYTAYENALSLLRDHEKELETIINELLSKEEIPGSRIKEILNL